MGHPVLEKQTEDAREFLQRRIAQFGMYAAVIQTAFFLVWLAVVATSRSEALQSQFRLPLVASTLLAPLISLAVHFTVRGRPRNLRTLWAIDAAGTFLLCGAYALIGWARNSWEAAFFTSSYTLLMRAVIVPTTSRRTLAVSAASYIPAVAFIPQLLKETTGPESWLLFVARLGLWILVPAVVSRVIYGLRKEVQDARKIGPYTLVKLIGRGGFGEVYKARHSLLKRETAIKVLVPDGEDEAFLRFEREAQAISGLSHPNTVSLYDYGRTPDGRFYFAMEYLPGINLSDLVQKFGPQPPARVIHILSQVCGSLAEAHGKGLIHRDIKPANIILCERGGILDFAKVVDFGLVKDLRRRGDARLTAPNVIIGTVHYLPPEALARPGKIDGRSDLYSLGAVGYYLLTGKPPFEGDEFIAVSVAQLSTVPRRPSEVIGRPVPAALEDLLFVCMDKEMDGRPGSAVALREALDRVQGAGAWSQLEAAAWWRENVAPSSGGD
jgi:serine/threonine-protein kinase